MPCRSGRSRSTPPVLHLIGIMIWSLLHYYPLLDSDKAQKVQEPHKTYDYGKVYAAFAVFALFTKGSCILCRNKIRG
jgi:hypothetical protein